MQTAKRPPASATRSSRVEVLRAAPPRSKPLEQILAETADGAFVTDPGASIILWNDAAERLLGWSRQEAVGLACCEVLVGVDRNGSRRCSWGCHALRARLVDDIRRFEMQTRTKAGRVVWLDITAVETPRSGGGQRVVHLFHEVTATVRALGLIPRAVRDASGPWSLLSARQLQILDLMAAGLNTRTMAARLGVSGATIRNHVQHIFGKLDVHSRLEAVAWRSAQTVGEVIR